MRLVKKALRDEKSLTPKERHDVYLHAIGFALDLLTLKDLRKTRTEMRRDPARAIGNLTCGCGCNYGAVMLEMVEGKIALREMGATKIRRLTLHVVPFRPLE
jgi:hypothetical protein